MNDPISDWDIYQYLLTEPADDSKSSFDRAAFEVRMSRDIELAERVAQAVAELQLLARAASLAPASARQSDSTDSTKRPEQERQSRSHANIVAFALAAAAILLLTLTVGRFGENVTRSSNAQLETNIAEVANAWLALENSTNSVAEELVPVEMEPLSTTRSNSVDVNEEQSDWLLEAAREFYQDNSGVAG